MSRCEALITSHFPGFILKPDRTGSLNCSSCMVSTSLTPIQAALYGCQAISTLGLIASPLSHSFPHLPLAQQTFPFAFPEMAPAVGCEYSHIGDFGKPVRLEEGNHPWAGWCNVYLLNLDICPAGFLAPSTLLEVPSCFTPSRVPFTQH